MNNSDRYDWVQSHFNEAKRIALFYIEFLERVINGEKLIRVEEIKKFAREVLNLELSSSVADGLFYPGSNGVTPGPIYRMGLEPRIGPWRKAKSEVVLKNLSEIRVKITNLVSLPDIPKEFYSSGPGRFLIPDMMNLVEVAEEEIITTSDYLEKGVLYSRNALSELFGIGIEGFSRGMFKPKNHRSIWLFVTRHKTPDRTQYEDILLGNMLIWDGEKGALSDNQIINHAHDGNELILFYRDRRNQFQNSAFIYEGEFEYLYHISGKPSKFYLQRVIDVDGRETEDTKSESSPGDYVEGNKRYVYRTKYERNRLLRQAAKKIHGSQCMVCGFNFAEFYGPIGHNYIQVHHLIPVCTTQGPHTVDPETELTVVCSNCHSMIHRNRSYALPHEVLRGMIEKQKIVT